MLHEFALYWRLIGVQIRSQLQYRLAFLLDVIGTSLATILTFATLAFVFQRFGNIAGWSLGEVAFLFGMVEAAFGVMDMVFSGFDPQNFGKQVRLGRMDQLLLRPVDVTVQVFGSEFIVRRLGRIIQGFLILAVAIGMVDIEWTVGKLLFMPVIFLSLVCFFGGLFIIGATFTFWTYETIEVVNIFTYGGSEMMAYPMNIYQNWLRQFFTFIIPAIFLLYYPSLYILDKPDPLQMPGFAPFLSPMVGLGVLLIAFLFWNFGLRHYQSTGT
jgi:ABC-2 type transport system permease protein